MLTPAIPQTLVLPVQLDTQMGMIVQLKQCAQLARTLHRAVSSVPGPSVVGLATPDTTLSVLQPVVVHLALGEAVTLREAIDMTPLDLGPDQDMILG